MAKSKDNTYIRAKRDLYNGGKCFSKNGEYEVVGKVITTEAGLMEAYVKNDKGERHLIGGWWRDFKIEAWEEEEPNIIYSKRDMYDFALRMAMDVATNAHAGKVNGKFIADHVKDELENEEGDGGE